MQRSGKKPNIDQIHRKLTASQKWQPQKLQALKELNESHKKIKSLATLVSRPDLAYISAALYQESADKFSAYYQTYRRDSSLPENHTILKAAHDAYANAIHYFLQAEITVEHRDKLLNLHANQITILSNLIFTTENVALLYENFAHTSITFYCAYQHENTPHENQTIVKIANDAYAKTLEYLLRAEKTADNDAKCLMLHFRQLAVLAELSRIQPTLCESYARMYKEIITEKNLLQCVENLPDSDFIKAYYLNLLHLLWEEKFLTTHVMPPLFPPLPATAEALIMPDDGATLMADEESEGCSYRRLVASGNI